jgi:glycosyltransferase involved in cell wall biosynthesis
MRRLVLQNLYKLFPFDLKGDCCLPASATDPLRISCVINFYGRLDLLEGILHSLAGQDFDRTRFEVILVEDRAGTDAGKSLAAGFSEKLQIVYLPLDKNFGMMGYSRNFGLSRARGDFILFLDDDTVILQQNFLSELDHVFTANPDIDAVVPHGNASFATVADRYDFHDDYFMTSRCTAYRRSVLAELGGFVDNFVGQEDVEFVTRFTMAGRTNLECASLDYFHPPLLVPNFRKPKAVGHSFFLLKDRYPVGVWLLLLLNCARHAPLYLLPIRRYREMGRFGAGFVAGIILSLFNREGFRYS